MSRLNSALIFVHRALIKDNHLSPSSLELFDTMSMIINCEDAIRHWQPDWTKCPACNGDMDYRGVQNHYPVAIN